MKQIILSAIAAAVLIANPVFAAVSKKDQEFFNKAAGGGMFEVEAGKLAQSKGQSDGVKSFGSMLEKDHGAANEELKSLAAEKGVTLPGSIPAKMQKTLDKLGKSKHFDKDFVQEVGLKDHKEDISLFEKTSKGADDADVKAFAGKALPTLKEHLKHAEGLKKGGKH